MYFFIILCLTNKHLPVNTQDPNNFEKYMFHVYSSRYNVYNFYKEHAIEFYQK